MLTETGQDGSPAPGSGPGGEHTCLKTDRILPSSALPAGLIDGESADRILPITPLKGNLNGQISASEFVGKRRADRRII